MSWLPNDSSVTRLEPENTESEPKDFIYTIDRQLSYQKTSSAHRTYLRRLYTSHSILVPGEVVNNVGGWANVTKIHEYYGATVGLSCNYRNGNPILSEVFVCFEKVVDANGNVFPGDITSCEDPLTITEPRPRSNTNTCGNSQHVWITERDNGARASVCE